MTTSAPARSPTAPERRQVRINGAPASVNSLSEWLSVLWLTPAMDRLFTGSAGERRRFLDRLVLALEPGHAHHAARYEAAMRARNKLLAEEAPGRSLARLARGGDGRAWRRDRRGARAHRRRARRAARPARPKTSSRAPRSRSRAGIGGDLAAALAANRARDAAAGRATEGPHRQDLAVIHRAKQMPAAQSSTGEQKALLLGLVLAHAELVAERRGEPPILLLDEVAAHLDPEAPRGAVRAPRRARPGVDDGDRGERCSTASAPPRASTSSRERIESPEPEVDFLKLCLYIALQHEALSSSGVIGSTLRR